MSVVPAGMVLVTTPAEHREAPSAARARIDERTSERTDASSVERFGERFDALLDELVEFEVREARIAARRAAVVDELRLLTERRALASPPSGGPSPVVWSPEIVARRTLATEIAAATRSSERAAETLVAHSRTLMAQLPETRAALEDGRIGPRHASILIDQSYSLPAESVATFEAAAVAAAEQCGAERFRQRSRVIRERLHPDSIAARRRAAVEKRGVFVDPGDDGMATLSAYLPAEQAMGAYRRITAIARTLDDDPSRTPDVVPRRTLAQRRADVLADLLLDGEVTATGTGRGVRAQVLVTVPVLSLIRACGAGSAAGAGVPAPGAADPGRLEGAHLEGAHLEGYGPIDDATAARLAARAPSFTRLLTNPETGAILSVGRDRYSVPADLTTALRVRDETCRFPGCGRSAANADIDHTVDWQHGGGTRIDNLAHLCPSHHRLKHNTDWTVRHAGRGTLQWRSPSGRRYVTEPARVLRL